MIPEQPVESKKGEVEFRRLLIKQQVEGQTVFNDEFDSKKWKKSLWKG